ncbi:Protein transport protein sec20 [Lodderomyces elongisporus]|uniref:Protein transport protein sec20 n=1 Tax=Lodderomyces elongisporus TaxID=36914 RepID=UPI0029271327|nr:Protein transport protein sec20 [Lodderomyces elongisporus]WLF81753.1 Protein transport protein sec20 [Lodderomyces elongisporus]
MSLYERLGQLQLTIFGNLDSLVQTIDLPDDEFRDSYDSIFSQISHNLLTYKDYLRILHLQQQLEQQEHTYGRPMSVNSGLQIYELKYESLKAKLRDMELFINDTRQEKLHQDRLVKFDLLPSTSQEEIRDQERDQDHGEDNQFSNARGVTNGKSAQSLDKAKAQLFANRSNKNNTNANPTSINAQINAQNTKITSSLQASRSLLLTSVLQSELNIDSIDQQSKDLARLNESFIKFGDLLGKSKGIVKFIEKQDKSDRQRIYLAMGFFLACCCWVIYRRVLRRPLRILFWSLFKIFNIFGWLFGGNKDRANNSEQSSEVVAMATATSILDTIMNSVTGAENQGTVRRTSSKIIEGIIDTVTNSLDHSHDHSHSQITEIVQSLSTGETGLPSDISLERFKSPVTITKNSLNEVTSSVISSLSVSSITSIIERLVDEL